MIRHSTLIAFFLATSCFSLGAATPDVHRTLARLPLRFETAGDGTLVAREGPYNLTVESGQTTVTVVDRAHRQSASVTTRLVGAESASRPVGEDPLAAKASYFLGADPAGWRSGAPLFNRAVERGVYRGIDLVFHGDTGSLEYDFLVHPGASARRIALDISGASAVRIKPDGALAIATLAGEIRWKKPEVYQWKDGVRQPVAGAFALHGRRVTFVIGAYDHGRDLVIDPTLAYATYLGGSNNDSGRGVAVDSAGNFYVTGFTFSPNLPHTAGSFQPSYRGETAYVMLGGDAFVAKYTPAGALVYVTYLGGSADDAGGAIAVDSAGNAYVTGFTTSTDFPTVKGSYQTTFGGEGSSGYFQSFGDAFVTKLNPTGTALVYSTYLGGSNDDQGIAIAVDSSGDAFVGGATLSTNFPTVNAYQSKFAGSGGSPPYCCGSPAPQIAFGDGFLAKLNPAGTALLFSTYFGGSLDDVVWAIALDSSGNAYIGGNTLSSNFPVLNAYQSKYGGAASATAQPTITMGDGFVAKFDTNGELQYSTYLGGSSDDAVQGVAVDSTGAAYVTGFTSSANFPVSATAAQKNFNGPSAATTAYGFLCGDAFVAKLAPSGSNLVWSTYLGGTQDDGGVAIAVDPGGNAIVGGSTKSTDFPVTSNAQQGIFGGNVPAGSGDGFVAKVSADGASFQYVSYYGGNASDTITSLALDVQGNVIVGGSTASLNLPITANAAQPVFGGAGVYGGTVLGDAFVAVFSGIASAPATPVLSISKTHTGNFTQGQNGATYTVTVSNAAGAGATSGTVTVTETIPSGLSLVSMVGTGWTCASNTCTRSDPLAAGLSYAAITVTVNVAANAASPQVNAVSVSGGGSTSANATDSTTISSSSNPPVLSISKTHTGNFTQGQTGAAYTVTVSNAAGAGATSGTVTVTETIPSGLSLVSMVGTGWTCASNTCTRSDALAAGLSYAAITVTVNVAANATSPQVNAVSLSGGGSASANTTDSTTIIANPPVLSISKTHTGSFTQGQNGATYTVTVSNAAGAGATNGTVTVTETIPSGLSLVSMVGTGWTCVYNTCTRSDALAAGLSYAAITVTVNVAANASSPQINLVSVGGGGSLVASATDSTIITQTGHPAFFAGEVALGNGIYYLQFPDGNLFGYYAYMGSGFIFHFDMGYEYVDPVSSGSGVYLWDYASGHWFYTNASLFPYLYDFTLNAWIYYFPDTKNAGHYTTNPRYFVNLATSQIFTM